MRLSKLEGGVSSDGGRAIMIATLLLCGIAHSALSELSEHEELHAISDGDALINALEHLPEGSIVYNENNTGAIFFYLIILESQRSYAWNFETGIFDSKRCNNSDH